MYKIIQQDEKKNFFTIFTLQIFQLTSIYNLSYLFWKLEICVPYSSLYVPYTFSTYPILFLRTLYPRPLLLTAPTSNAKQL
jgi:hypothetical protein